MGGILWGLVVCTSVGQLFFLIMSLVGVHKNKKIKTIEYPYQCQSNTLDYQQLLSSSQDKI